MSIKLSIIELGKDETVFYNLGVFLEGEKLLIFPYEEFKKFYEDLSFNLECLEGVIDEGLEENHISTERSLEMLKYYLDEIKDRLDNLLHYDIQTTMEGYQGVVSPTRQRVKYRKERPQCLLGL
ncbi:MAG: hypothetical protein AB1604_08195 [Euryarchaeota archaeon]